MTVLVERDMLAGRILSVVAGDDVVVVMEEDSVGGLTVVPDKLSGKPFKYQVFCTHPLHHKFYLTAVKRFFLPTGVI